MVSLCEPLRGACIHAVSRTPDRLTRSVKELGSSTCCRNLDVREKAESASDVTGIEIGKDVGV